MEHLLFTFLVCMCFFSLTTPSAIVGTDCSTNSTTCSAADSNSECAGTPKKCACKDGYEAKTNAMCLKVDHCKASLCKNGGTCANGTNTFTCTCAANWTGLTCAKASLGACTGGNVKACPTGIEHGKCVDDICVCEVGFEKKEKNCVSVPDNAAVKTVICATVSVTFGLMIALLQRI